MNLCQHLSIQFLHVATEFVLAGLLKLKLTVCEFEWKQNLLCAQQKDVNENTPTI